MIESYLRWVAAYDWLLWKHPKVRECHVVATLFSSWSTPVETLTNSRPHGGLDNSKSWAFANSYMHRFHEAPLDHGLSPNRKVYQRVTSKRCSDFNSPYLAQFLSDLDDSWFVLKLAFSYTHRIRFALTIARNDTCIISGDEGNKSNMARHQIARKCIW